VGLLERTDGLTVVSGWRHQARAVGLDAATGVVLWDTIPASDGDFVGVGVPDLTGDGNEDLLVEYGGVFRLYDGVTGAEQTWYSPIAGRRAAYSPVPEPAALSVLLLGGLAVLRRRA